MPIVPTIGCKHCSRRGGRGGGISLVTGKMIRMTQLHQLVVLVVILAKSRL